MFNFNEQTIFTAISILIGFAYGFIAQQKQFCFSGGIKDIILFQHTRRTSSLFIAIITALILTQSISYFYEIDLTQTRYFLDVNYLFIIVGGILFGYGMMISDGCSSRHLIKFSQGDIDSLYILIILGLFSYLTFSLLSIYNNYLSELFIIQFFTLSKSYQLSLFIVLPVLLFILYKNVKKPKNLLQISDGIFIGFIIALTWYITSILFQDLFIDIQEQSLSFVYPLGKIVQFVQNSFSSSYLIFPVLVVFGVLLGSFVSSKFNKQYSKNLMCDNSQQNPPKLFKKLIGGACMGVGGILAIGCTVGQGLSGLSTLSFASLLAIASIYISAYITAKSMHKNNALIACFIFDFSTKK